MTDAPAERGPENPWERLRRRKVVQWGLAYAAGAWVILQVLGFAADSFGWPTLVKQLAMLSLAVGLPILLTLAWYHGERAQQRVTGQELGVLTLLFLIGGGLLWWYAHRPVEAPPAVASTTAAPSASATTDARPSIAVLPFENRSDAEKDVFFVDGIHDDVLTQLTKVGALKVIARTSVEQFGGTTLTTKEIGEKLGVTKVLEGGVQRAGDRVRVTVQLIDAATDAHLWAENYDRELTAANIFAIQSEVAAAIANALNASLTAGEQARIQAVATQSLEAWQAYQLGNLAEAWASAGLVASYRLNFKRAEEMLRRAISLNPNYAPASHWLSTTLNELGRRDEALVLAERAVLLDPPSAVMNSWLGSARADVGRFDDGLVAFRRAVEIDPAMAGPYISIGGLYALAYGRFDRAVPWYERAATLDPSNPYIAAYLAQAHWDLGDDTEARSRLPRALAMGEGVSYANGTAALLYLTYRDETLARKYAQKSAELDPGNGLVFIRDHDLRKGDYAIARARYEKAFPELFSKELSRLTNTAAFAAIDLALVLQHTGEGERASALLDHSEAYIRTIPRMGPGGYRNIDVAIHALRGDTKGALASLREAQRAGWRGWWRYDRDWNPNFDSIRNEPEFNAVFADIERDMARQRAALATRPKDAPLELTQASKLPSRRKILRVVPLPVSRRSHHA